MAAVEIPQPWAQLMVAAEATDPRNGNPSLSQLSQMTGHHTSTASKLILRRDSTVSLEVRAAVAGVLGVDSAELDRWVGKEPAVPYKGPAASEYLTARERRAVDEVIRMILGSRHLPGAEGDQAAPSLS